MPSGSPPASRLTVEEPSQLQPAIDVANPADEEQLLEGFYEPDPGGWRWAAPEFTVSLGVPEELKGKEARIELDLWIPEAGWADLAGVTITAKTADRTLGQWRAPKAGAHTAVFAVPAAITGEDAILVDFVLDRFIPPRGEETRRLGVVASKFRLMAAAR
ncbi:MAG: hypothetical protein NZM33_16765 [Bryobacteraceae bacterium]|nr:hypothetical protein [Bryobacteraceae bacterium]